MVNLNELDIDKKKFQRTSSDHVIGNMYKKNYYATIDIVMHR